MANLHDVRQFAISKMHEWGLYDWHFKFDRAVRRYGVCSRNRKTITLSKSLTLLNSLSDAYDVVLHELAHALSPPGSGHNHVWKLNAIRVGAKPDRCYEGHIIQPKRKWIGVCPNCETTMLRFRRRRVACKACCIRYNQGKFDSRFLFRWKPNL